MLFFLECSTIQFSTYVVHLMIMELIQLTVNHLCYKEDEASGRNWVIGIVWT